jgi:transcription elongation factor Elf1
MSELPPPLPCPFCGNRDGLCCCVCGDDPQFGTVQCPACGAQGPDHQLLDGWERRVVDSWNDRVSAK